MSIDAIVWLAAGTGFGITLSMLVLALFAAAERRDLQGRRQRAAEPAAPPETSAEKPDSNTLAAQPTTPAAEPTTRPDGPLNVEALFAEAFAAPKQPALAALPPLDRQQEPPPSR